MVFGGERNQRVVKGIACLTISFLLKHVTHPHPDIHQSQTPHDNNYIPINSIVDPNFESGRRVGKPQPRGCTKPFMSFARVCRRCTQMVLD